MGKETDE
jgi:hypothetical protein